MNTWLLAAGNGFNPPGPRDFEFPGIGGSFFTKPMLIIVLGGDYLLRDYGGAVGVASGTIAIFGSIVLTFFEAFVQLLQAYVFTLLSALYIGGALLDEH